MFPIQSLVQSAECGNVYAYRCLCAWIARPRNDQQISERQGAALAALLALLTKDETAEAARAAVAACNGKSILASYGAHDVALEALACLRGVEVRQLALPGDADVPPVHLTETERTFAAARGYVVDEIFEFKEDWMRLCTMVSDRLDDGLLARHHFVAFVVDQFGQVATEATAMIRDSPDFSFLQFLDYMDSFESESDDEASAADEPTAPSVASGGADAPSRVPPTQPEIPEVADHDDWFYLGTTTSEPRVTLRKFTSDTADLSALLATLRPTESDYRAVFRPNVVDDIMRRCERAWSEGLVELVRPVHSQQKYVGVYDIAAEYEELWQVLQPLVKPDVTCFGFDFNTEARFSVRGSAKFAFLANGRYFPSLFVTMLNDEFQQMLDPRCRELHVLADRIMVSRDVSKVGAELRPSLDDWLALFEKDEELAHACHTLYERSVGSAPQRPWQIGPVVSLPYGIASYYRYDAMHARPSDLAGSTPFHFPEVVREVAPKVNENTLLCGLRLKYGLMTAPDPSFTVPPEWSSEEYEYFEGDFAPAKTFTLLAQVNGKWSYFPRKIIASALGYSSHGDESTSEPEFYSSSESDLDDESHSDDEEYSDVDEQGADSFGRLDVEGGRDSPSAHSAPADEEWACLLM